MVSFSPRGGVLRLFAPRSAVMSAWCSTWVQRPPISDEVSLPLRSSALSRARITHSTSWCRRSLQRECRWTSHHHRWRCRLSPHPRSSLRCHERSGHAHRRQEPEVVFTAELLARGRAIGLRGQLARGGADDAVMSAPLTQRCEAHLSAPSAHRRASAPYRPALVTSSPSFSLTGSACDSVLRVFGGSRGQPRGRDGVTVMRSRCRYARIN